nr:aminotransferase class I/II-fold pyridoxal phosphate-dependent enzyme [Halochromatium glycolicum]
MSGRPPQTLLDFSANINPLGMPAAAREALIDGIDALGHYPDPNCTALRQAIAAHHDIDPALIVAGNGAEQLIWWLPRLVHPRRVLITAPCYVDYRRAADVWGVPVQVLELKAEHGFRLDPERLAVAARPGDLVWVGQPNNPTGMLVEPDALEQVVRHRPDVDWAIDEAFIDFVEAVTTATAQRPANRPGADSFIELVDAVTTAAAWRLPNLIVLRSMTKFYALAGLRLGYAVLSADRADALAQLLPDWSVNRLASAAGVAVLAEPERSAFAERTRVSVRMQRQWLAQVLRGLGLPVIDGQANYLLLRLPEPLPTATVIAERLLTQSGIAVRVCDNYAGLDERYLRIAVRTADENQRLVGALQSVLGGECSLRE